MVNWNDPVTLQNEAAIFGNAIHFTAGLYAWETVTKFVSFDWHIISGKRAFRWPMLLYFACRYLMFLALVGLLIVLNVKQEINCQALYTFNQFAGNSAIGFASSLLMLRTIAVWDRSYWITIPIITVNLGQWAILLHGMTTVVSSWDPQTSTCVVLQSRAIFLDLIYFYTMSFDLLVLVLTTVGLFLSPGRSNLWRLLFTDGIVFFALAFISNSFPAVFLALNLNPVMNVIFSVPAAGVASVAACHSFIRLSKYSVLNGHTKSSKRDRISTRIGTGNTFGRRGNLPGDAFDSELPFHSDVTGTGSPATAGHGGVHVVMETFTSRSLQDGKSVDEVFSTPQQNQTWEDKNGHSFSPDDRVAM